MISLLRDREPAYKIGIDGGSLLWVAEKHMLRIDSSRQAGADYPGQARGEP